MSNYTFNDYGLSQIPRAQGHSIPQTLTARTSYQDQMVGLEVELEFDRAAGTTALGTHVLGNNCRYPYLWRMENDGSLRSTAEVDSKELVLDQPIPLRLVPTALEALRPWLATGQHTFRAGVHVHVNACEMKTWDAAVGLLSYAMLEDSIFEWVGGGRRESIFCVPLRETISNGRRMLSALLNPGESGEQLTVEVSRWPRYTALNLNSLSRWGSIEFRHLPTPIGESAVRRIQEYVYLVTRLFGSNTPCPTTRHNGSEWRQLLLEAAVLNVHSLIPDEASDLLSEVSTDWAREQLLPAVALDNRWRPDVFYSSPHTGRRFSGTIFEGDQVGWETDAAQQARTDGSLPPFDEMFRVRTVSLEDASEVRYLSTFAGRATRGEGDSDEIDTFLDEPIRIRGRNQRRARPQVTPIPDQIRPSDNGYEVAAALLAT